jgi:hypothetical protein
MWQEYYDPQIAARNRWAVTGLAAADARRASAEVREARTAGAGRRLSLRRRLALAGAAVAAVAAATTVAVTPVWMATSPSEPAPAHVAPAAPQLGPLPDLHLGSGPGRPAAG